MLRDRIITGVFDKKLQLKLLDGYEQLTRVVDVCKTFESANVNKGIFLAKQSISMISLEEKNYNVEETSMVSAVNNRRFCFNCGNEGKPDHKSKCPAKDFTCACGKKSHFRRMCQETNQIIFSQYIGSYSKGYKES